MAESDAEGVALAHELTDGLVPDVMLFVALGDDELVVHTVTVEDRDREYVADAVKLRVKAPDRERDPDVHVLGDCVVDGDGERVSLAHDVALSVPVSETDTLALADADAQGLTDAHNVALTEGDSVDTVDGELERHAVVDAENAPEREAVERLLAVLHELDDREVDRDAVVHCEGVRDADTDPDREDVSDAELLALGDTDTEGDADGHALDDVQSVTLVESDGESERAAEAVKERRSDAETVDDTERVRIVEPHTVGERLDDTVADPEALTDGLWDNDADADAQVETLVDEDAEGDLDAEITGDLVRRNEGDADVQLERVLVAPDDCVTREERVRDTDEHALRDVDSDGEEDGDTLALDEMLAAAERLGDALADGDADEHALADTHGVALGERVAVTVPDREIERRAEADADGGLERDAVEHLLAPPDEHEERDGDSVGVTVSDGESDADPEPDTEDVSDVELLPLGDNVAERVAEGQALDNTLGVAPAERDASRDWDPLRVLDRRDDGDVEMVPDSDAPDALCGELALGESDGDAVTELENAGEDDADALLTSLRKASPVGVGEAHELRDAVSDGL